MKKNVNFYKSTSLFNLYNVISKFDSLLQHLGMKYSDILVVAHFGDFLEAGFDGTDVMK